LAAAIKKLIDNPSLRERIGGNSRQFVEENCTQRGAAKRHYDLFRSIIRGS
jgi:hypothetical protein